ncbi:MAG: c-type cytochrome [Gammaproteobacteria bacterium]|nr:c-type cytochrome [Gammaproteobacteria bacterium]
MNARHFKAVLIGLCGLLAGLSAQAADIEAGKAKSALCMACHGADGNSTNVIWPRLAGQHASYLAKQLRDYKSGKRVNATMQGMVAALTEEDMDNLAAFYSSQQPTEATYDDALLAKGQDIYRGGITETSVAACMGCHSPSGDGNGPAAYPSLKGQHMEYTVSQLKAFKDGVRANDGGKMMRNVANRMSDQEMQAVAAYLAGMK